MRSQLPRVNPYYPAEPPDEGDIPGTISRCRLAPILQRERGVPIFPELELIIDAEPAGAREADFPRDLPRD